MKRADDKYGLFGAVGSAVADSGDLHTHHAVRWLEKTGLVNDINNCRALNRLTKLPLLETAFRLDKPFVRDHLAIALIVLEFKYRGVGPALQIFGEGIGTATFDTDKPVGLLLAWSLGHTLGSWYYAESTPAPSPSDIFRGWVRAAVFYFYGPKTYRLSSGLAKQLFDTRIHGLLGEDIRLPHASMRIEVPRNTIAALPYRQYVLWEQDAISARGWGMDVDADSTTRMLVLHAGIVYSRDDVELYNAAAEAGRKQSPGTDIMIRLRPGEPFVPVIGGDAAPAELESMQNFVVNTIVYATHADAEVDYIMNNPQAARLWKALNAEPQGTKRRARLQQEFDNIDQGGVHLLGKSVIYVSRAEDAAAHGDGIGTSPRVRFRVSGHWRNQAHGPAHTLRRLTWIQPHWKGPELAPVKAPPTTVLR